MMMTLFLYAIVIGALCLGWFGGLMSARHVPRGHFKDSRGRLWRHVGSAPVEDYYSPGWKGTVRAVSLLEPGSTARHLELP